MKLFQRLLVAPAALGLLSPLSATASEVNLNEISNYSDIESIEFANSFNNEDLIDDTLVAGGEGLVDDNVFDGSATETTTLKFTADLMLGAIDNEATADSGNTGNGGQSVMGAYSFQIDVNTTFTGEDSLDIAIDAGNSGSAGVAEFDGNGSGDTLMVDGVSYTFPIGAKTTAFVGDNTDGSLLFDTACVYGGPSNTLDDCGNNYSAINAGGGYAFGASYDIGSGFTAAFGYTGSETGLMTEEGDDAYAGQLTYSGDNYGISLTYAHKENPTFTQVVTDSDIYALNAYYTPDSEGFPSISVGYETATSDIPELSTTTNIDSSAWFVGLSWDEVGPGTAGIAVGTKQHTVDFTSTAVDDELLMYEAYYSYNVNDSMTITPLIYTKEFPSGTEDETGLMVKTSFSF